MVSALVLAAIVALSAIIRRHGRRVTDDATKRLFTGNNRPQ